MSQSGFPGLRPLRPGPRKGLAFASILLLVVSLAGIALSAQSRLTWVQAPLTGPAGRRQAALVETSGVIADDDEAAMVVAEGLLVLDDASNPKALAARRAEARRLALDAVWGRPASAYGRLVLARATLPAEGGTAWARGLELSAAAAPGLDLAWTELASRYLSAWRTLPAAERPRAHAALRRAFEDPEFLRGGLPVAVQALGPEAAVAALPDDPAVLILAAEILRPAGGRPLQLVEARMASAGKAPAASRPTP